MTQQVASMVELLKTRDAFQASCADTIQSLQEICQALDWIRQNVPLEKVPNLGELFTMVALDVAQLGELMLDCQAVCQGRKTKYVW